MNSAAAWTISPWRLGRRGRERGRQRAVVGVGEVEDAVLAADRLAAQRVGGAEPALAALAEVRGERGRVALLEAAQVRRRHVWLLDPHGATAYSGRGVTARCL